METTIASRPLDPFGAEIDVDLGAPLTTAQQDELRRLYATHDLLLARGQRLTMEDQVRVMGYLGPVLDTPDGRGQIRHDNGLHTSALAFHSDLMFSPEPILGISLHTLEVGDTSTRFADARLAYERLDPELRRRINGRDALHVFALDLSARNRDADVDAIYPRTTHPIVRSRPVTGAPILFVCRNQTDSIVGLAPDESEELLSALFAVLYDSSHVFEHTWRVGDIAIWDNLAVQHGRADITAHGPRVLQRVALGTRGIAEQHPELADHYR